MKNLVAALLMVFSLSAQAQPLTTETNVDVSRYVGKWYSHFALPQFFTRNCKAQTAEYEVIDTKTISVLNTCIKKKGKNTIEGQAVVTNLKTNAELEVTFNSFFTRLLRVRGDYNIMKLDPEYEYVLVGSANRKSLWLMSRSSVAIPDPVVKEYLDFAEKEGFDTSKLVKSKF